MKRAYNFNAGPSAMPETVMREAQNEFLNYQNTGMGIIEMSHRSKEYDAMHQETKALLRELMEIPDNYEILFIQVSGTNFNRPGFAALLEEIEAGHVETLVVKDLSRFGRNYLQVGYYTEILLPKKGVRFMNMPSVSCS